MRYGDGGRGTGEQTRMTRILEDWEDWEAITITITITSTSTIEHD